MLDNQGEKLNNEPLVAQDLKKGVVKNKEVIAKYDNALSKENINAKDGYMNKLELLKQKLGLGGDSGGKMDIKTNLIDNDDVATFIDWKSSLNIFISYFVVLLIVISGSFSYFVFLEAENEKNVSAHEEEIISIKRNIQLEEQTVEEAMLVQEKLAIARHLLNNHIYWTNFFDFIEENTLKTVFYGEFSGDKDLSFSFSATADDAYFNAIDQIKAFKQSEFVESVGIERLNLVEDEEEDQEDESLPFVQFNLELKIDPIILLRGTEKKDE